MRAVIYARYSSTQQREASIEDQVRLCRERVDAEGWSLSSHVHRSRGERVEPAAAGLPEAAGGCPGRRVRCGGGRGAGPAVARPGGRGRPVQAAALCRACGWSRWPRARSASCMSASRAR